MSRSFHTRPSTLLSLCDPVEAYHLDRAVMHFGSSLESALEQAVKQGKRKKPLSESQMRQKIDATLTRWLGTGAIEKKYRDPAEKLNAGRTGG